jgi:hypothetical protein
LIRHGRSSAACCYRLYEWTNKSINQSMTQSMNEWVSDSTLVSSWGLAFWLRFELSCSVVDCDFYALSVFSPIFARLPHRSRNRQHCTIVQTAARTPNLTTIQELNHSPIDWLIESLIDWLIGWLMDWYMVPTSVENLPQNWPKIHTKYVGNLPTTGRNFNQNRSKIDPKSVKTWTKIDQKCPKLSTNLSKLVPKSIKKGRKGYPLGPKWLQNAQ